MIRLFTCFGTEVCNPNLAWHSIKFWKAHGVNQIHVVLQASEAGLRSYRDFALMIADVGLVSHASWIGEYRSDALHQMKAKFISQAAPNDWTIVADGDEFPDFHGQSAREFFATMGDETNVLMGRIRDRHAVGFVLPEITRELSLSEQFPIETSMTRDYVKGGNHIALAIRHGLKMTRGRLDVTGNAKPHTREVDIHHFKWDSFLQKRMIRRVETYKRLGVPWVDESERILENLRGGQVAWHPRYILNRKALRGFLPAGVENS